MATTSKPRLYFAYGSNLSLAQMKSRCPTSTYHSFGLLRNYKWIIGERGYANVISSPYPPSSSPLSSKAKDGGKVDGDDVVYGMLYTLQEQDERNLDRAEGVPWAYEKRELEVEILRIGDDGGGGEGEKANALVYVDEKRLGEGVCREEYVVRINRGLRDAREKGMSGEWISRVVRKFVREEDVPGGRY